MKKYLLITITLFLCFFCQAQETYTVGRTEYYYNQYYSTTGNPVVKRSETNKQLFLISLGHTDTPDGYEIDHIKPLCEGGEDDPNNMQLLTVEQHKKKTAKERANRSNSTYSTPTYTTTSTSYSGYEEPTTTAPYSRTDSSGRMIYKGSNGGEYYVNGNGNKVYVTSNNTSSKSNSIYSTPSSSSNSSSREILTGPRGGTYYINSNGNKTYTKK